MMGGLRTEIWAFLTTSGYDRERIWIQQRLSAQDEFIMEVFVENAIRPLHSRRWCAVDLELTTLVASLNIEIELPSIEGVLSCFMIISI